MCIDTQTHMRKLSCTSINILAANYGEGKRHQATSSPCVCVFSQIKATGKAWRTVQMRKAFSKGRKMSRAPGSLWELRAGSAQVGLCAEKLGHGVCHTSKVRGLLGRRTEERKQSTRTTPSSHPLSGKRAATHS